MSIEISDYPDVYDRAIALDLREPTGLAILPRGFETATSQDELVHEAEAATLRKLWREAGVEAQQVQPSSSNLPSVVEKSSAWVAPTVFIGTMLLSENPMAFQLALDVLKSYVVEMLNWRTARVTFVVEKKGARAFKKLDYAGPVEGLGQLPDVLRRLHDNGD